MFITEWGYPRIHFQLHPPVHLRPRLVLSGRYKRTWTTSYNPSPLSLPPLKRDITPRYNVQVITINLYDSVYKPPRTTRNLSRSKVISQRRAIRFSYTDDTYVGIFFLQEDRGDRAIVQATKFGPLVESRTGCRFNTKQRAKQRREVCKYDAWILLRINAIA